MGGVLEERRKYRRLDIRTDVLCKKIDSGCGHSFKANSINISTEGLLAEIANHHLMEINDGELFGLEMDVPVEDNTDLLGGKLWAYGKVVRIVEQQPQTSKKRIAFQFCTRPMFEI
ncbi:MAG: PilZ domain-containing protein [Planctomycetaceae bacterium]|nr:PilZ domain-containing protein [Planctomycetaceae bacterium]